MFGKYMGVDQNTWIDWLGLAVDIVSYHNYPRKFKGKEQEKQKQLEEFFREKHRNLFEGKTEYAHKFSGVVQPYSHRLKLNGIDLALLKPEEEEKINEKREKEGKQRLNWERVRRLDELAKQCNESLRTTIYQNAPFEWKWLYETCKEANKIIYGESGDFFKGIKVEE